MQNCIQYAILGGVMNEATGNVTTGAPTAIVSVPNISHRIADRIREMIVAHDLEPGQRVNEVRLAGALGVSRTPLREALSSLAAEGALTSIPRKGFYVAPLTVEELKDIYPIRAILDPAALRMAGLPAVSVIDDLERLNVRIEKARDVESRIRLDDDWHLKLVGGCGNAVLIDLIRQFIRRTHRYEYGYLRSRHNLAVAVQEHREILAALRADDLESACDLLRQNMTSGLMPLIEWLENEERA